MPEHGPAPVTLVVAMTPDGVIGRNGTMPWRLSTDLRRFKQLTMGGVLVMGRKTYDSIGRPLPGRRTIVLTRDRDWTAAGVEVAHDPDQAIRLAAEGPVFVVGGAQIYQLMASRCDQVFLTRVLSEFQGDTHLRLDLSDFRTTHRETIPAGERDEVPTEFLRMIRETPGL